ncbi:hypothetical protein [Flavobacterium sp. NRK1]|uniref:hypothetical protein n=1 Tax=Flavobacterium sp. NRK1 TaxID=2954929 RepID=UPI00209300B6|nr:hypothetical protein [Flavobacterium sp. NRK1]MCO6149450.1 hypothetical protein [Flavobacterium sp. NRK1]
MPFKKEDLKYKYKWEKPFNEKSFIGMDDYIDRENGQQMLAFFNRFLKLHGLFSLGSLHRLEKLFCKYMPKHITTRSEIKDWLGENWNRHFN